MLCLKVIALFTVIDSQYDDLPSNITMCAGRFPNVIVAVFTYYCQIERTTVDPFHLFDVTNANTTINYEK